MGEQVKERQQPFLGPSEGANRGARKLSEKKRRMDDLFAVKIHQAFDPSHHSYNGSSFSFLSDDRSAARPRVDLVRDPLETGERY